ncbi:hypothetical protein [Pseudoclavibacter sp. JSM 162008]|uniref:hypothetical protein n=1 Tax=Pseudoclavibacter sp. JSM 162008 TaxID=3229855 RepID=UPI003525C33A
MAPTEPEAVAAIEAVAPEVFEGTHPDLVVEGEQVTGVVEDPLTGESNGVITLDADNATASVQGVLGPEVTLEYQVVEPATTAITENAELVVENATGVTTISNVTDDASVRVTSTIASPESDHVIPYAFSADGMTSIVEIEGGSLLFLDENEEMIGGVAPAWALDAAGVSVPTRYEIDGLNVTQVVDVSAGSFEYPIVADPLWGTNLFSIVDY